jgi:hypothetical protein
VRLPNWLKIVWWIVLLLGTTLFLAQRYADLANGDASPVDVVVILVWLALMLVPIFQEVTLWGLTLKQQIDTLKEQVSRDVASLRADVRSAIDVRNTFNPQITVPMTTLDTQLPDLERIAKAAARDVIREHGAFPVLEKPTQLPEDVEYLFSVRYNLEREVLRISASRGLSEFGPRVVGVVQLLRLLTKADLISPDLERTIREVYAICSAAIHGQDVTSAKVAFVRDIADDLLAALRALT